MPLVKGGIEGEFEGRVYPVVVGLRSGPRLLHMFGEGTTWVVVGQELCVKEPSGDGGMNELHVPLDNVAFVAKPMFLAENPPK